MHMQMQRVSGLNLNNYIQTSGVIIYTELDLGQGLCLGQDLERTLIMKNQIQIYITIQNLGLLFTPLSAFGADLDRVRVWSGAQDIRIYININVNISKFRYIYQKIHSTNKNNLFNCDEDSNVFLQLYIVVHYYIFSTIHPLNIFSIYIYIYYI